MFLGPFYTFLLVTISQHRCCFWKAFFISKILQMVGNCCMGHIYTYFQPKFALTRKYLAEWIAQAPSNNFSGATITTSMLGGSSFFQFFYIIIYCRKWDVRTC